MKKSLFLKNLLLAVIVFSLTVTPVSAQISSELESVNTSDEINTSDKKNALQEVKR